MDSSPYRSLAFLFSLGTLPIACGPKGGDTTDGSTGGTDPTTGTTDGTPATTSGEPTSGEPTSGSTTTSDGTETGGADGACQAYVDYLLRCEPETAPMQAEYLAYCAMLRLRTEAVYGPFCLSVHDAVYECLQAAPCDDLSECEAAMDVANGCLPEAGATCVAFAAKEAECYDEPVPDYAAGGCQVYVNSQIYDGGPACGAAVEELFACLVDLPCLEFQMMNGCEAQREKLVTTCGGGP